jgi:hypothetical protein
VIEELLALEQLVDEIVVLARLKRVEEADDVRVLEVPAHLGLMLGRVVLGARRDLDGDITPGVFVCRAVDRTEAADADDVVDLVASLVVNGRGEHDGVIVM